MSGSVLSAPPSTSELWRPSTTRAALELRARALAQARSFFATRGVLEVDTPLVVNAGVTDVHIHSAQVSFREDAGKYFLHTSPEYAMKRLLAAGSGDIYQICHVVRALERGRLHNAEFTLIEWYRLGFTLEALMDEVEALVRELLGAAEAGWASERISYQEAFLRELSLDPFTVPLPELVAAARAYGYEPGQDSPDRDELLELLMSVAVGPRLGLSALTFVHRYPATQAALARIDPQDPRAALRFELYSGGVELANGFDELCTGFEQRVRFEQDVHERARRGLPALLPDERLLAALEAGLPPCAGVALGFDRTLMLAAGASRIDDVLPFPIERA
jgi:lysyl-tRNA synthetase class 2